MKPHSKRRPGRIDQLPAEFRQLIERMLAAGQTKSGITRQLNEALAAHDQAPVSRHQVNRYTSRMQAEGRRMLEMREAAQAWAAVVGEVPDAELSDYTIALVRTMAAEQATRASDSAEADLEAVTKLALAVQRLEGAQQRAEQRIAAAKRRAADQAGQVMAAAGLSDETVALARRRILGIP